jgi:tRNA pseudouridine38-40 synthase
LARYQIILAYDGTRFAGSQRQANTPTVQRELEGSLSKLGWQGKSILLAGRTDSGVHAAGQVAAVDLDWPHAVEDLRNALNASLPLDIAVQQVRIARAEFHPRFDAVSRWYRYRLFCQPVRDPLRERYAWRVTQPVDPATLAAAAGALTGRHDFAAFGTAPRKGSSTLRTVMQARWVAQEDEFWFDVRADAFLYRMVRRMVYVQVAAGQRRLDVEAIRAALAGDRSLPAGLAPACGLTLMEVTYPSLDEPA